jgi:DNA replication initiation complex subunit (GINS family)
VAEERLRFTFDIQTAPLKTLQDELKRLKQSFAQAAPNTVQYREYAEAINVVKGRIKEHNALITQSRDKYFELGTSLRSAQMAMMQVAAVYASSKFFLNLEKDAARIGMLNDELSSLGKKGGFNAAGLLREMDVAAGGTLTKIDALTMAMQAVRLGNIDLNKMAKIVELLDYRSKLLGEDTKAVFDEFIRGAETGNKRFQIRFGLLYDVDSAQKKYAESIGVTTKELTDEEKQFVNVKVAIDALIAQQGVQSTQNTQIVEQYEKMAVYLERIKEAFGSILAGNVGKVVSTLILGVSAALESITYAVQKMFTRPEFMILGKLLGINIASSKAEMQETLNDIRKIGEEIRKVWGWAGIAPGPTNNSYPTPTPPSRPSYSAPSVGSFGTRSPGKIGRGMVGPAKGGIGSGPSGVNVTDAAVPDTTSSIMGSLANTSYWVSPIVQGFQSIGDAVFGSLIKPLQESNSLFSKFVAGVLQGISQIVSSLIANAIVGSIFSWLFPGAGGFGNVFKFLGGDSKALGGGSISAPQMRTATSFGGGMGSRTVVEVRARGREFYGVMKQEKIIDSKAGGRW